MQADEQGTGISGGATPPGAALAASRKLPRADVLMSLIAKRKSGSGTEPAPSAAPVASPRLTPERGIATAIARAAQEMFGLPVHVLGVRIDQVTLADLPELIPEKGLISLVEGAGEALGCVILGPDLTAALIEQQTMGRLSAGGPVLRRATRTDAVMCADYVSGTLRAIAVALAPLAEGRWFESYRYGTWLDDPRPLGLMLDDTVYRMVRAEMRLGLGDERTGTLLIALPGAAVAAGPPDDVAKPATVMQGTSDEPLGQKIRAEVAAAQVSLDAVLCRRKIPLALLRRLAPGEIIPLGSGLLDGARLETRSGLLIAEGRLGERDGCHALRLRAVGACTGEAAADGPDLQPVPGHVQPDSPATAGETGHGSTRPGPSAPAEGAPPPAKAKHVDASRNDTSPLAIEPPIADLRLQDPFREDAVTTDDEPEAAPILPMNFSIG